MRLSVIVPFHNVEPFLGACLESLARQTVKDFEVVMVDDGSFDGSTLIAKDYAARDPRFRLYRQETLGPGPARNHGLEVAQGEYVAFADGDDLLTPDAYAIMLRSLAKTGSDLVCANAWRFDERGQRPSWAHRKPFQETLLSTHIKKHPGLVYDRMVWNKVYRRSLIESHNLRFPSGLYEDGPIAMAAHVFAESVDVLQQRVYYWRERRSGDAASITQRWIDPSNLTDRLASVRGIADFLVRNAPSLKVEFDKYTLDVDIRTLFRALHHAPEEERPALIELAAGYLDSVTPSVFSDTDPYLRLCCHLALNRMVPELMELVADEPPIVHRLRNGHHLDLPFLGDKTRAIPDEIYAADDMIELHSRIDDVGWHDGRLRMEGHAYIRCVPMGPDSHIRVSLWHERTGTEVDLPVTRVVRPDVTVESRQTDVSYDHSGFVVEVDPAQLRSGRWSSGLGNWSWRVQVRAGGHKQSNVIKNLAEGRGWWLDPVVMGSTWVRHTNVGSGALGLQINEPGAILTGLHQDGGVIQLNGRFTRTDTDASVARLVLTRDDSEEVEVPASIGPPGPGGRAFHCRVPLTALVTPLDVIHRETHALTIGEGMRYEVRLVVSDQIRSPLAIPAGLTHGLYTFGDREIRLTATRYGNLTVAERVARPTVTSWGARDGRLTIAGEYSGPRPDALILRRHDPRIDVPVPLTWTGTTFAGSFEPPEPQDTWTLLAETEAGDVSVVADRKLLAADRPVVGWAALGAHKGDSLVVRVKFDPVSD